ncbi:hypothetical protein L9F63_027653, partial [Diploptera punctata]
CPKGRLSNDILNWKATRNKKKTHRGRPKDRWEDDLQPKHLQEIVFDICPGCRKMSSVPQGAYATWKVRLNEGKNQLSMRQGKVCLNAHYLEQPPAKYNSKLMNSIWGLYNRYSVHNLKKVTDGEDAFAGVQKSMWLSMQFDDFTQ